MRLCSPFLFAAAGWHDAGLAALLPEHLKSQVTAGQRVAAQLHPSGLVAGCALVVFAVIANSISLPSRHPALSDDLQVQLKWLRSPPKVSHTRSIEKRLVLTVKTSSAAPLLTAHPAQAGAVGCSLACPQCSCCVYLL